jgi:hypothetical protein
MVWVSVKRGRLDEGAKRRFEFLSAEGITISPEKWLEFWAKRYPSEDYAGYEDLIAHHKPEPWRDPEYQCSNKARNESTPSNKKVLYKSV